MKSATLKTKTFIGAAILAVCWTVPQAANAGLLHRLSTARPSALWARGSRPTAALASAHVRGASPSARAVSAHARGASGLRRLLPWAVAIPAGVISGYALANAGGQDVLFSIIAGYSIAQAVRAPVAALNEGQFTKALGNVAASGIGAGVASYLYFSGTTGPWIAMIAGEFAQMGAKWVLPN